MIRQTTACLCSAWIAFAGALGCMAQDPGAEATLINTHGVEIGTVAFWQTDSGVIVQADIKKLAPGEHAFHIHETGVCEAPDFTSADGHFNPRKTQHGFLNPKGPHAGDLPNIIVANDSTASYTQRTKLVTLKESAKTSLFKKGGTAVVIHENPDDYITDPAGAGGSRIACGIIKKTEHGAK